MKLTTYYIDGSGILEVEHGHNANHEQQKLNKK